MIPNKPCRKAAMLGLSLAALVATPASAHHAWGTYAWEFDGVAVDIPVYDNTTDEWRPYVQEAVDYWNASDVISMPMTFGNNSSCSFMTHTIQVCNADFGANGWLGLASIALSNGHIIAASTKLNDHYFSEAYNSYSWRQLVTCQELGHDLGLAHQDEDFATDATQSCMEYTSRPADNEHPDWHDYEQLALIYVAGGTDGGGGTTDGGTDGGGKGKGGGKGSGGGGKGGGPKSRVNLPAVGNTPESWGRPVDYLPNGRPHVFVKESAGMKFVTHVTYAPDEGGDHDHDH